MGLLLSERHLSFLNVFMTVASQGRMLRSSIGEKVKELKRMKRKGIIHRRAML